MTEPDAVYRLDPALRTVATTRTNFSLESIPVIREGMNERRKTAAEQETASAGGAGVAIADTVAEGERPVPVRIYRGGPAVAPAVIYCHAGGFALGNLDTRTPDIATE